MKKLLVLVLMLSVTLTYSQEDRKLTLNKETNLIDVVYYHDNGEISQKGSYTIEGKLHGEWLSFSAEGQKLISANYDDGAKEGKWFYWNDTTLKEIDYNNNAVVSVNVWTDKSKIALSN